MMDDTQKVIGNSYNGWIGVDLDGTLAHYESWKGPEHIGKPIKKMVDRVINWVNEGIEVRILTGRAASLTDLNNGEINKKYIQKWLYKHIYPKCPVWHREPWQIEFKITHEKDHLMLELWDDRCVQVIPNTGERADGNEGTQPRDVI